MISDFVFRRQQSLMREWNDVILIISIICVLYWLTRDGRNLKPQKLSQMNENTSE